MNQQSIFFDSLLDALNFKTNLAERIIQKLTNRSFEIVASLLSQIIF